MLLHRQSRGKAQKFAKPVRRRQNTEYNEDFFAFFGLLFSFTEQGRLFRLFGTWRVRLFTAGTHFVEQSRLRWNFFWEVIWASFEFEEVQYLVDILIAKEPSRCHYMSSVSFIVYIFAYFDCFLFMGV